MGKAYKLSVGSERVNLLFGEMDSLCLWCHPKPGECCLISSILEMKLKAPGVERL